jgi:hypothetical protein
LNRNVDQPVRDQPIAADSLDEEWTRMAIALL